MSQRWGAGCLRRCAPSEVSDTESGLLEDFPKPLLPSVLGGAPTPAGLGDSQTFLRPSAIPGIHLNQLFKVPVTKDFLPQIVQQRQFPTVGCQVAPARGGTLKIARLCSRQSKRCRGQSYAEIDLAAPKHLVGLLLEL